MKRTILFVNVLGVAASVCFGQIGSVNSISFQGALNGANGQPLPNGPYNLTFRFWDGPGPGANLVSTNILVPGVLVSAGLVSTSIPVDPAWFSDPSLGFAQTRYVGVAINGGEELAPRIATTAVPYSLTTRGIRVNPPVFTNAIQYLRPTNRVVVGSTTEDISRVPPADTALVIGTTNGGVGSTVGIYFDTFSRANAGLTVENVNGTNVEDTRMHFYIGNHALTTNIEAMTINEQGYVGIGTNNPQYPLHIDGFHPAIEMTDSSASPAAAIRGNNRTWLFGYAGPPGSEDITIGTDTGPDNRTVTLYAGGLGLVRVAANGNVGIGTMNPQAKLDVSGTASMTVCQITSDRNAKTDFQPVDAQVILEKLASLPIATWSYTNSPAVRHLGPVAQDFAAAFQLGEDDKHIATVDADGVALAAIQGLDLILQEKQLEISTLKSGVKALEKRVRELEMQVLPKGGTREQQPVSLVR